MVSARPLEEPSCIGERPLSAADGPLCRGNVLVELVFDELRAELLDEYPDRACVGHLVKM